MRKYGYATGCALTVLALLLGSPVARADNASFVDGAKALGFATNADNLISMGRSACYFLGRNRDPGQVVERIMRYGSVDRDAAGRFLVASVAEYCPQFGDRVGG